MGYPVTFEGANIRLLPPEGQEDSVMEMPAMKLGHNVYVSCWRLTQAEIDQIVKTGTVYLSLITDGVPPAFVGALDEMKDMLNGV